MAGSLPPFLILNPMVPSNRIVFCRSHESRKCFGCSSVFLQSARFPRKGPDHYPQVPAIVARFPGRHCRQPVPHTDRL
jgi:hypothetical protein